MVLKKCCDIIEVASNIKINKILDDFMVKSVSIVQKLLIYLKMIS